MMSSPWGGSQFRNGQVRVPVWIARRALMVGMDSGMARVKRRLSLASAARLGGLAARAGPAGVGGGGVVVGMDSGMARVKRRLSLARASRLGVLAARSWP